MSRRKIDIHEVIKKAARSIGMEIVEVRPASMQECDLSMIHLDIELELEKWLALIKLKTWQKKSDKEMMAKMVNRVWPLVQKYHRRAKK